MVDENKAPTNKTSDGPTEIPTGVPTTSSTEVPKKISEVPTTSPTEEFVCEECGKPFPTKKKLSGHMSVHSKKSYTGDEDLPDEFLDEQETLDRIIAEATPTRKRKAIVRMVSRHLGNKRESIETLAEALRLADIPSHLRNLIVKNWASHMDIPDIEDILDLDVEKKEEKKKGEEEDKEKLMRVLKEKKTTETTEDVLKKVHDRRIKKLDALSIQKEIADMEKEIVGKEEEDGEEKHTMIVDGVSLKLTASEMLAWKRYLAEEKRAEAEREERKEERKQQAAERQQPNDGHSRNDGGLVEWVVGEGNNTRTIKVRPETIPLLIQAQGAKNNPQEQLGRDDVMRERMEKLEAELSQRDADRMQRLEDDLKEAKKPQEYNPGSLTKGDLLYMEARDKLKLEEKKLDEGGKTREVISNAIRGGFDHAGKIISRMMTEEGATGGGTPVSGYSNREENMMHIPCPTDKGGCGAMITAPIGSSDVTCPGCGKRWTVDSQRSEQTPPATPAAPPPKEPASTDAGFSVDQPTPIETPEKPEEEFTPEEKEKIEKSLEDAKEGRITPLKVEEPETTTDAPAIIPEPTSDASKIIPEPTTAGPAGTPDSTTDAVEEEVKKEKVEKKPWPTIDSDICPIPGCNKKCKGKHGVSMHILTMHPEYEK